MKYGLLAAFLCLLPVVVLSSGTEDRAAPQSFSVEEASEYFINATSAYNGGEYQKATEQFESLVGHGYQSGPVFYNLGNARLRNGKLGEAIGAYLHAKRYLPRDGDLAANLKFARQSAKDDLPEWKPGVLETVFFWHRGLSMDELGQAVLVLNGIFWLVWLVRIYRSRSEWLSWLQRTVLLALVALGSSFGIRGLMPMERAVVLPPEVSVHASTQEKSTVLFKLHEGAELSVVDQSQEWVRVSLPDKKQGWIAARHVMVVKL